MVLPLLGLCWLLVLSHVHQVFTCIIYHWGIHLDGGGAGNAPRRTPVPSHCAFRPSVLPVFLFCRDIPLIVVLLCVNVT